MTRVFITGLGCFTPIGCTPEDLAASLAAGTSGLRPVSMPGLAPALPELIGGEVAYDEGVVKKTLLKPVRKSLKVMCREIQLGVAAAASALQASGVKTEPDRIGIEFGANLMLTPPSELFRQATATADSIEEFDVKKWADSGYKEMEPLWLLKYLPNMPACHIGILADAQGPNNSLTQDEASAFLALAEACRVLQRGWADAMICGATGTRVHEMKSTHAKMWDKLGLDPETPAESCRPFDRERNGQVVGEGAAAVILETEEAAQARNAPMLAEVLGNGASCVIASDGTPNFRRALAQSMHAALRDAGVAPSDVAYISAHGIGTVLEDQREAEAIHDVFGDHAAGVPVFGLKGAIGNSGASSGMLQLAAALAGKDSGHVPVTVGHEVADPSCNLRVVHEQPLDRPGSKVLMTSVTRLGQASATLIDLL